MYQKLRTGAGDFFERVAEEAKRIASEQSFKYDAVEFEFNRIICRVHKDTDLGLLCRDYCNAFRMEWATVGPDCEPEYSAEVEAELQRRNKEAEEKSERQRKEDEAKDREERENFEAKTKGIEIEIIDTDKYNDWKAKNTDGYGAAIFEYAEGWAKLMQIELRDGKRVVDCAEYTSHELGFMGITGYMYGAAVAILSGCWKYGEDLRKWHNNEYSHDGEGVVNPALLEIR